MRSVKLILVLILFGVALIIAAVVPLLIVFVFASRQLIAGLTAGATKG